MSSTPDNDVDSTRADDSPLPLDSAFDEYMTYKSDVSEATAKAYRNDYVNLRGLIARNLGVEPRDLTVEHLRDKTVLWAAFGSQFKDRPTSSRQRAWSTWNGLCEFMVNQDYLSTNPMRSVRKRSSGTPPPPPESIEGPDVFRLLAQLAMPDEDDPNTWRERDLALVLSGLLLGLRTGDMISMDIGDFTARHDQPGAMTVQLPGKGSKYRHATAEPELTRILEKYLISRAKRFPDTVPDGRRKKRNPWRRFDPEQPCSSVQTDSASPAARSSTESSGPTLAPASRPRLGPTRTACATPSPSNSRKVVSRCAP